ncbi:Tol-Pal system beta propeller repeat protein TolB [Massilia sp. PAMC28688]|uniref:Tol-Pal system beta propeller repeat protein TolB n=1 Tax=Massilia sp. PAMC28688 TaxID=2861283 RepID=UPI001C62D60D|nr:Tol-Pal system beta propeller repeat protein TolB [Massilia sp. PAMC28688]QYF93897.1 Tol-Pal system beta propeller repeat protein TolB [Massilia sp. PAMC28688]
MKKLHNFVFTLSLLAGASANAQLKIEIAGVGSNQIPVAVAAFADESVAPAQISSIIKADLERSGVFKVIDAGSVPANAPVDYSQWKSRGADALVVGSVQKLADGRIEVRYRLHDTVKTSQLSSMNEAAQPRFTRLTAHRIADDIYEKLTGTRGAFATRVAYVNENRAGRDYRLEIADADGEGTQVAVRSNEPIISPSWSPDGTKVAYVSFEKKKPVIYVQNLVTGARKVIVNEKGSNSAPSWSPDGTRLAVALSKDGNTQVYSVSAEGGNLRRLSNSNGIDTEPQYSADGQTIYFTSDRSGGPQIYKMSASGGNAQRVTFKGNYNISPRVSDDGKTLAWISQRDGGFSLYAMNLATGQEIRLADGATEPSFSPNGKYIMYATKTGGRTSLAVVSVDGRVKQRLTTQAGNIREPNWGPFMK